MKEGPKFILALCVLVVCVMFGGVAIIDAAEPGTLLDQGSVAELTVLLVGIAGASVGLSLTGIPWKRAKRVDPPEDTKKDDQP